MRRTDERGPLVRRPRTLVFPWQHKTLCKYRTLRDGVRGAIGIRTGSHVLRIDQHRKHANCHDQAASQAQSPRHVGARQRRDPTVVAMMRPAE
eukprot:157672-Rhodomonas_salina.2